jgi:O-antigen ligase
MVAKPDQGIFQRIMYGSLAALNAIFLAWTGSRTGVFVATLGLAITFRYRLHRLVILGAFTFAFLLLIVSNFVPASWFNEHLVSTEDTRSAVWYGQLDQFVSHPLTGTLASGEEFGYGENSYLAAAARYGIIGIIPLMLAVGLCVVEVIRLNANKRYLRKDAMLVDLVTGCVVALGVGAWFEGYLLASFSFPTYCLLANFAMITALRDLATLHYNQSMGYIPSEETDEMYAPEPAYADYALDG